MATDNGSVIILGATSGMARATANEFAKAGHALVLAAMEEGDNERIAADLRTRYEVEVTTVTFRADAFDTHPAFVETCIEKAGGAPDGVVLCFGYMTEQADAEKDFALARRTIDVCYTGAVSVLEAFAVHFQERKAGFIAAISSVAGDRGRQSNYIYGSAKAGLTAYLAGLRNRMFHHGVQVTTIKPGFVDTAMTHGLDLPPLLTASPEQAGRAIYRAIVKKRDTTHVLWFWKYIMLIIRSIPEPIFKRMTM